MLQGRTADQKRKLAARLTDAMVEEAGARREAVVVTFVEVSKESYASGGVLIVDDYGYWQGSGTATDEYFRENGPKPFLVRIDSDGRRVAVKP